MIDNDAAESPVVLRQSTAHNALCDFCSGERPSYRYPTGEVRAGEGAGAVISPAGDPWLADEGCHELIEAGRFEELADVAVLASAGLERGQLSDEDFILGREHALELHAAWRAARLGPALPI